MNFWYLFLIQPPWRCLLGFKTKYDFEHWEMNMICVGILRFVYLHCIEYAALCNGVRFAKQFLEHYKPCYGKISDHMLQNKHESGWTFTKHKLIIGIAQSSQIFNIVALYTKPLSTKDLFDGQFLDWLSKNVPIFELNLINLVFILDWWWKHGIRKHLRIKQFSAPE